MATINKLTNLQDEVAKAELMSPVSWITNSACAKCKCNSAKNDIFTAKPTRHTFVLTNIQMYDPRDFNVKTGCLGSQW